jgi:hypothetical protein
MIPRKLAKVIGSIAERWFPSLGFMGSERVTVNNFLVMAQPSAPQAASRPAAQRDAEKDATLVLLNSVASSPRQRAKVRIHGDKWEGAPEGDWILTIERAPATGRIAATPKQAALPSAKEIS